jgi:hypothetical protein
MDGGPAKPRRRRVTTVLAVGAWALILAVGAWWGLGALRLAGETTRVAARFDPPVWAGQNVPGACSGGFYARAADTIVLTIVAHCAIPGTELRDPHARLIGTFGPMATLADCPTGRFCAPSDFLTLSLTADFIPWGHLNMVDLGAGGYRTFDAVARPLACGDLHVGAGVQVDGRERYRTGRIVEVGPYEHETDTMFPCMAITDIDVGVGDSGGAVLVDGAPAGIISRDIGGHLSFTPLAEGLENLGLILCTTPSCDLSPEQAVQPTD